MSIERRDKALMPRSFYACIYCTAFRFQSWNYKTLQFSADRKIPTENSKRCSFQVITNVTTTQNLGMTDKRCLQLWSVELCGAFSHSWKQKLCNNHRSVVATLLWSHTVISMHAVNTCWKRSSQRGLNLYLTNYYPKFSFDCPNYYKSF